MFQPDVLVFVRAETRASERFFSPWKRPEDLVKMLARFLPVNQAGIQRAVFSDAEAYWDAPTSTQTYLKMHKLATDSTIRCDHFSSIFILPIHRMYCSTILLSTQWYPYPIHTMYCSLLLLYNDLYCVSFRHCVLLCALYCKVYNSI